MRAAMGTAACACALVLVGTTTAWTLSGAGMPLGGTGVMPSATQMSDPEGGGAEAAPTAARAVGDYSQFCTLTVEGGVAGEDYVYEYDPIQGTGNTLTIKTGTALTISTSTDSSVNNPDGSTRIVVDVNEYDGSKVANLTFKNVDSDCTGKGSPVEIKQGNTLNLTLAGDADTPNKLVDSSYAGVSVATGATLNIVGSGALDVTGGSESAGIGGSGTSATGTINIDGGTIIATGGKVGIGGNGATINIGKNAQEDIPCRVTATGSTGIGAGVSSTAKSTISIDQPQRTEVSVTATGNDHGAGIGSESSPVDITIGMGTVNAAGSNNAAGIGTASKIMGVDASITINPPNSPSKITA